GRRGCRRRRSGGSSFAAAGARAACCPPLWPLTFRWRRVRLPPRQQRRFSAFPLPADARLPRLHDRCLRALLQRLLATLHQRVDRVRRRRRLGTQTEEKFCLCQGRLGIAVAIELQPCELEVRLGCPRREGDRSLERLLRRLVLPCAGEGLTEGEGGGVGGGIELRSIFERIQGGVLLPALVQRAAEGDLRGRPT